jgi:hypothetical protein
LDTEILVKDQIPTLEQLSDKKWRLQNLYYITDKNGQQVKFNLNWAQSELFDGFWYQMLILKARQLGCTTFFAMYFLDDCFWYKNTFAGIIAHRKEDAEDIFKKKVKFAYDRMPEWTRVFNSATNDRVGELTFKNGSSYRVSTGFRSGTYQRLLISEFGKICAKSPDVAKEIVTGSLNTVSRDQISIVESTAEGREGYFYDFSKEAERLALEKKKLSQMQMKFFFLTWWREPTYAEPDESIVITQEINDYLDGVEKECNTVINFDQRRWYELMSRKNGDSMKQEYPSTPAEAFETSNDGLYYGKQISKLRADGHITKVPYQECSQVHTSFDIGFDDHTAIWFFQLGTGGQIQIIDYYENCNEGAKFYVDILKSKSYTYGTHILPHDAENANAATVTSWKDIFQSLMSGKIHVLTHKESDIFNGIQSVRSMLGRCYFDESKCSKGVKHLEAYKKEWNERIGSYRNCPLHDSASHAADSFRYLATALDLGYVGGKYLTPDKVKEMRNRHGYK